MNSHSTREHHKPGMADELPLSTSSSRIPEVLKSGKPVSIYSVISSVCLVIFLDPKQPYEDHLSEVNEKGY